MQSNIKLGKLPARHDLRTLQFEKYIIPSALPPIPEKIAWQDNIPVSWGMMQNDSYGDCTCAAAGHMIMNWTGNVNVQTIRIPGDQQILDAYAAITGFDPVTGLNDNGAVVLDVLKYWRNTGINNDKITAFAGLENQNIQQVKEAVYLFGGCYLGVALPNSAKDQKVWSIPPYGPYGQGAPGSWGGHAIPVVGYDSRYLAVVTWGEIKFMTWGFFQTYCDEAYAVLSIDWINPDNNKSPVGFDMTSLQQDLKDITHSAISKSLALI
ncbi:hypothetical protein SAMN04488505_105274 [Chitinophaga rupis]|uniref:Peptidase C1A papain C-terminal domain-containing protein n=1 Tax=Chitinophaga rupis TaxID=573321 RepID=A0A1H8A2W4_9BACT|nr:hypothetical protein [Chitinophaga rupis]SEM64254.1 hypothetical protein SAMN04488505_105274 [Chitinophaga rupis]